LLLLAYPSTSSGQAYENPRGFSIRFVFAKLVAETPACGRQAQLILYKTVGLHNNQPITND